MSDAMMAVLRNVRFHYGDDGFELRIPEFALRRGETAAVIGPSGSGKTTLLNLIAGIALPQAGSVVTDGVEISGLPDAARRDFRLRRLGLVFQEFELLEYLSVLDNILLPHRISGSLRLDDAVRDRAAALAHATGVADELHRNVDQLSQGERQRVAVCRALIAGPGLLLADEPTGNLDPSNKARVLDVFFDAARASGVTLLAVTHDHALLDRFDRVIDVTELAGAGAGS